MAQQIVSTYILPAVYNRQLHHLQQQNLILDETETQMNTFRPKDLIKTILGLVIRPIDIIGSEVDQVVYDRTY